MSNATTDVSGLVASCNRFALDLLAKLDGSSNLFLSPASISTALAMALAGAAGETAEQIAAVLHSSNGARLHERFLALRAATKTGTVELKSANRIWGQRGYPFLSPFLAEVERCYGAQPAAVDFQDDPDAACREINLWVDEQTGHRIAHLVSPALLPKLTRLLLANAVYFAGRWESEFEPEFTKPAPFWTAAEGTVSVPMMRQRTWFGYGEFDELQVVELPYRSHALPPALLDIEDAKHSQLVDPIDEANALTMCVLLPRQKDGLAPLQSQLTVSTLQNWTTLRTLEVDLWLPKFRIEWSGELTDTLGSLGMRQAFENGAADFSRMSSDPEGLFIGSVLHKSFVDVDEKGTEAAAATAMMLAGGCAPPEEPKIFRADRPFLFLIRDRTTRLIHFVGRVVDPAG